MTDEQIEKGLELCAVIPCSDCFHCPYEPHGCKQDLLEDALDYIKRLKANLESAVQSFTKMETLYKVKCKELEVAEEWKRRQKICNETNTERIMQLEDEKEQIRKETAKEILNYILHSSAPFAYDIEVISDKYGVKIGEDIYRCNTCQKNNNAEWNENNCPLRAAGECEEGE